jgi:hypothetical protein
VGFASPSAADKWVWGSVTSLPERQPSVVIWMKIEQSTINIKNMNKKKLVKNRFSI